MHEGRIQRLMDGGFGFIEPFDRTATDGKDLFFHAGEVRGERRFDSLIAGERVSFEIDNSDSRGPRALGVRVLEA